MAPPTAMSEGSRTGGMGPPAAPEAASLPSCAIEAFRVDAVIRVAEGRPLLVGGEVRVVSGAEVGGGVDAVGRRAADDVPQPGQPLGQPTLGAVLGGGVVVPADDGVR